MTSNQAAYAAILAKDGPSPRRIDRIRARISTNKTVRALQNARALRRQSIHQSRSLHVVSESRDTGPRSLHPGDILYWVACLGGACLLLLCATT